MKDNKQQKQLMCITNSPSMIEQDLVCDFVLNCACKSTIITYLLTYCYLTIYRGDCIMQFCIGTAKTTLTLIDLCCTYKHPSFNSETSVSQQMVNIDNLLILRQYIAHS